MSLSSLLLAFDPTDDLILKEGQSAAGPEPEVRKPPGNEGLPYGPRAGTDQLGNLRDVQRPPEPSLGLASSSLWIY